MVPVVRYMIPCDDVSVDETKSHCVHVECVMGNILSHEDPPFPLVREQICIYLVLTEGHGMGVGQIRVAFVDDEPERLLFGSPEYTIDFRGHTPLELLSVVFRIRDCVFPRAGRYSVQFWYNDRKVEERPLRLR